MRALILTLALATPACDGGASRSAAPESSTPIAAPEAAPAAPPDAAAGATLGKGTDMIILGGPRSLFLAHVGSAHTVFVGTLTAAGPGPGFYSGYKRATQTLTYKVLRVLRGDLSDSEITVHHTIVAKSPALAPDRPELAPELTEVGVDYIVALSPPRDGTWLTANENVGPLRATDDDIAAVESALQ